MKKVNMEDNYEEHLEIKTDQIPPAKSEDEVPPFESVKLGSIIKQIREKEHLTIEELAKRCDTTPDFIRDVENDATNIDISKLSKIVRQGLDGKLEIIMKF